MTLFSKNSVVVIVGTGTCTSYHSPTSLGVMILRSLNQHVGGSVLRRRCLLVGDMYGPPVSFCLSSPFISLFYHGVHNIFSAVLVPLLLQLVLSRCVSILCCICLCGAVFSGGVWCLPGYSLPVRWGDWLDASRASYSLYLLFNQCLGTLPKCPALL